MPSPVDQSMSERAHFARLNGRKQLRIYNPETRAYLHLSGAGETKGTDYAWCGTQHQAETLAAHARETGKDWPYVTLTKAKAEETAV